LEFIQAVLWHVDREGFHLVPVPLETVTHAGFVIHQGHFWELTPWVNGRADFHGHPTSARLAAALRALAEFHRAAASFPLPHPASSPSPAIRDRLAECQTLASGGLEQIEREIHPACFPELADRSNRVCNLFRRLASRVAAELRAAASVTVRIQPCLRDVWHDHVIFDGPRVSGFVDFGAMRPESVAADVSRLLGSLVRDEREGWRTGLEAYESVRPLTAGELSLVFAFDRSSVLLSAVHWLDWVFRQRRAFDDRDAVVQRVDEVLARMAALDARL
jgi:Ser/Thr protein kinase RdoA (MazF antagonist)